MKGITRPGTAALALLGWVAVTAAGTTPRPHAPAAAGAPAAHLVVYGGHGAGRTVAPRGKLDAALADLERHAAGLRPGSELSDLRALNPAARFQVTATSGAMVAIDAITRGDPQKLKAALVASGLQHPSQYLNDVSGWLPLKQIAAAAARPEVHALRAALPRTRAGAVTSTGDYVQGSSALRGRWPAVDGTGVTVGILSDSYNCYATYAAGTAVPASGPNGYASNGFTADAAKDMSTGDLPAQVNLLAEAGQVDNQVCMDFGPPVFLPYTDEGRGMLQVVHDVAPGAGLAFHTATEGEGDFANGVLALAAAGAKVIGDDIGYFDEPFFQPSLVGQAIDTVHAQGVAYFVAAGNDGQLSYDNTAPSFSIASTSPAGEMLLNFGTSGSPATTLSVTIAPAINGSAGGLVPGEFVGIIVEWDQPFVTGAAGSPGASSQLDLCVSGSGGDLIFNLDTQQVTCTGANTLGTDPVQVLFVGNPANAAGNTAPETITISLGLVNGSPAPGRVKIAIEDDGAGSTINLPGLPAGTTLQGHAGADGAMSMGAAFWAATPLCGTSPAQVESFTSAGGDPILFDKNGNPLAVPLMPQKPDLVGPDGGNTTFLGFTISGTQVQGFPQCTNDPSLPSFFGTSAATPHAAGVAALMLQANAAVTADQIYSALKSSAAAMTGSPSNQVGAGFIQAEAALALLPPGAPKLTLSAASIPAGQSATLTWSSVNTSGCTASGSWGGAEPSSGTTSVTPAAGNHTYTLTCANGAGTSTAASASLAVQAPAGGGGGALGVLTLLMLAALASWRAAGLPLRTSARRVH